jgi:hypothetical protein
VSDGCPKSVRPRLSKILRDWRAFGQGIKLTRRTRRYLGGDGYAALNETIRWLSVRIAAVVQRGNSRGMAEGTSLFNAYTMYQISRRHSLRGESGFNRIGLGGRPKTRRNGTPSTQGR